MIATEPQIRYEKGYIAWHVKLGNLPKTVTLDGVTLGRKSEFHCSLVCVKCLTPDLVAKGYQEDEIPAFLMRLFDELAQAHPLTFSRLTGEFHHIEYDERQTLIVMAEIKGLSELIEQLNDKLGLVIPVPPTHVTLFTLQPDAGIGVTSTDELVQRDWPISESDLEELDAAIDLSDFESMRTR